MQGRLVHASASIIYLEFVEFLVAAKSYSLAGGYYHDRWQLAC